MDICTEEEVSSLVHRFYEALSAFLRSLDGRTLADVLPRRASVRLPKSIEVKPAG